MHKTLKALTAILVLLVAVQLTSCPTLNAQTQEPQQQDTLAQTINNVLCNASSSDSAWNAVFDQVFCRQNASAFDSAIMRASTTKSYADVIFIARLAEINGYSSITVTSCLKDALENMPMVGSLPMTYENSFIVYDRYIVNAYRYAQTLGVSKWNIDAAYSDFVKAYMGMPQKSENGEMLYLNPATGNAVSFSSRYYDEHAETLDMFLEFYLNGEAGAMAYADDAWLGTQTHWNDAIYGYTGPNGGVECEMGNFAQVAAEYRNSRGDIAFFNRTVMDLENKLLRESFNSTGWGRVGVIRHSDTALQNRLYETMGCLIALQMLYPDFTVGNQTNFQNMLQTGWLGLLNSSLYNGEKFSFMDHDNSGSPGPYVDDASMLGAMTLFLYGVVPQNGSLAIDASNEKYQDYLTCFPTSKWQFNYSAQQIRIPVYRGNLTFIYGTQNASASFPDDGVYNVQFSSDWNTIIQTQKIADITRPQLQNVTLTPIDKPAPTPSPSPATVASSNQTSTQPVGADANSTVTLTPTESPSTSSTAPASPTSTPPVSNPFPLTLVLASAASIAILVAVSAATVKLVVHRKKMHS